MVKLDWRRKFLSHWTLGELYEILIFNNLNWESKKSYDLWVTGSVLSVACSNLQVTSLNPRVTGAIPQDTTSNPPKAITKLKTRAVKLKASVEAIKVAS